MKTFGRLVVGFSFNIHQRYLCTAPGQKYVRLMCSAASMEMGMIGSVYVCDMRQRLEVVDAQRRFQA